MNYYHSISEKTGKPTGVQGYEYGPDYIVVFFTSGVQYVYNWISCGKYHVEVMKELADSQHGLNSYITRNRPGYLYKA